MKRFTLLAAIVLPLFCATAHAQKALPEVSRLVCSEHGFTASAEDFHNISTNKVRTVMDITKKSVVVDGHMYVAVDPGWAGLDGLAITYYAKDNNKVLYLYINEQGLREVGVSTIENDSDAIFSDKALYRECKTDKEVNVSAVEQPSPVSWGKVQTSIATYTF